MVNDSEESIYFEYEEGPISTSYHLQESIDLSNARPHRCAFCQATFKHELSLLDHRCVQQDGDCKFKCQTCNITFDKLNRLIIHERKHKKERPYECAACNKTFKEFGTLTRHEESKHGQHRSSCPFCEKIFSDSQSLNRHVRSHSYQATHECEVCHAVFKKKSNLEDHQRTHTGESRCVCTICSKPFKSLRSLRFHLNRHTGKLPYQCQICMAAYRNPVSLKQHERIHTGEKPYPCDLCSMLFRTPSQLRNHKRNHNVKRMSALAFELSKEHGVMNNGDSMRNVLQCRVCDRVCRSSVGLTLHEKIHLEQPQCWDDFADLQMDCIEVWELEYDEVDDQITVEVLYDDGEME